MNKNEQRATSLACRCCEMVRDLLIAVGQERRPADRVLRALFRERRELGARDRRVIRETVFAVFRWWGWLHPLAPPAFQQVMNPDTDTESPQTAAAGTRCTEKALAAWSPLLLAAQYLEWEQPPLTARILARNATTDPERVIAAWSDADAPADRVAALRPMLDVETPLPQQWSLRALIPAWSPALIDSPEPLDKLIACVQRRPPLWLRVQGADPDAVVRELRDAGLQVQQHARRPDALALMEGAPNVYQMAVYRRGHVEVQDLASQFVGEVCAAKPGQRWWDACAGGGGKALLLASRMEGRGKVVASDIRAYKLKDLRLRARRAGFPNIEIKPWDGKRVDKRKANFDGVLVDAPCSGSGTWARNADARWRTSAGAVTEMTALQLDILRNAASAVRPGGVLVYATCSMFQCENNAVLDAFLREASEFFLDACADPLTGADTPGYVQVWPWMAESNGMFMARMRRS